MISFFSFAINFSDSFISCGKLLLSRSRYSQVFSDFLLLYFKCAQIECTCVGHGRSIQLYTAAAVATHFGERYRLKQSERGSALWPKKVDGPSYNDPICTGRTPSSDSELLHSTSPLALLRVPIRGGPQPRGSPASHSPSPTAASPTPAPPTRCPPVASKARRHIAQSSTCNRGRWKAAP